MRLRYPLAAAALTAAAAVTAALTPGLAPVLGVRPLAAAEEPGVRAAPAAIPGVKNYYRDLFAEPAADAGRTGGGVVTASFEAAAGADRGVIRTAAAFDTQPNPFADLSAPAAPAPSTPAANPFAELEPTHPLDAPPAKPVVPAAPAVSTRALPAPGITAKPAAPKATAKPSAPGPAAPGPAAPKAAVPEPAAPMLTLDASVFGFTPDTPSAAVDPPAETGIRTTAGERPGDRPARPVAAPVAAPTAPAPPAGPRTDGTRTAARVSATSPSASPTPKPADAAVPAPPAVDFDVTDTFPAAAGSGTAADAAVPVDLAAVRGLDGPQAAAVRVEWVRGGAVRVGRVAKAELVVRNDGRATARDVTVTVHVPAGVELTDAVPPPNGGGDSDVLTWRMDALAAGAEETVAVTYVPRTRGEATLAAFVRFTAAAGRTLEVVEPALDVAVAGADRVNLGDPAPQQITVSNPGTGTVEQVVIEATIDDGLEHATGKKALTMSVGRLDAGESRSVRLSVVGVTGGPHAIRIQARAEDGLRAEATADVEVVAPEVSVALTGPKLRYVGRDGTFVLAVTNGGTAPANNVRLAYLVPDGFQFAAADRSGRHLPGDGKVTWFLGTLAPGETLEARVRLTAEVSGEHRHRAEVAGEYDARSTADLVTTVDGAASLVLEIADRDDPVEVGAETAYDIVVTNEGTAAAKAVGLACRLPDGVTAESVDAPGGHRRDGRLVLFEAVPTLPPGGTLTYRITVRGTAAGRRRLQTRLVSESIGEPLIHEESTMFYGE